MGTAICPNGLAGSDENRADVCRHSRLKVPPEKYTTTRYPFPFCSYHPYPWDISFGYHPFSRKPQISRIRRGGQTKNGNLFRCLAVFSFSSLLLSVVGIDTAFAGSDGWSGDGE
jgi:hypothetical protein